MEWEIRYYLTQAAHKGGVRAFKETINGPKDYAVKGYKTNAKVLNL